MISRFRQLALGILVTAICVAAPAVRAQDAPRVLDASDLADGMRLYQQKGGIL